MNVKFQTRAMRMPLATTPWGPLPVFATLGSPEMVSTAQTLMNVPKKHTNVTPTGHVKTRRDPTPASAVIGTSLFLTPETETVLHV